MRHSILRPCRIANELNFTDTESLEERTGRQKKSLDRKKSFLNVDRKEEDLSSGKQQSVFQKKLTKLATQIGYAGMQENVKQSE